MTPFTGRGKHVSAEEDTVADRVHDVAIVGTGPVGQTCALLLGRLGHDVLVLDLGDTNLLARNGAEALVVRPDCYVHDSVSALADLPELVARLRHSLLGDAPRAAAPRVANTAGRLA